MPLANCLLNKVEESKAMIDLEMSRMRGKSPVGGVSRLVGAAGLVVGIALAAMPAQAAAHKTHAPHKSATEASREKSSSHGKTAARPGGASHEAATVKGAKVAARDPETTSSIGPAANDGLNCN